MQQIEFTVDNTALATVKDIVINANFDEVEAALKEMVAPYASMIVTEDAIADAKSDRAKLRKVRTSIDDYRKSVEKAYKQPVEVFKSRVKPLLEICDTGIENLDSQVKSYEAAQKQAKIGGLRDYFIANAGEAGEFITFEQIINPKWENNGFSVEDAQKEIDAEISKTMDSVSAIRSIGNEFVPSLLQEYARCHDLVSVLRINQQLIDRKAAEEQRKAAESERERLKREAEQRAFEAAAMAVHPETAPADVSEAAAPAAPEVLTVDFRVWATQEQLNDLKAFLTGNGIRYGRVPA